MSTVKSSRAAAARHSAAIRATYSADCRLPSPMPSATAAASRVIRGEVAASTMGTESRTGSTWQRQPDIRWTSPA